MTDEYDYLYGQTPNSGDRPDADDTPQAENIYAYSQDDMDEPQTARLPQEEDFPKTKGFDDAQPADAAPEENGFPQTEPVPQQDFTQPVQGSFETQPSKQPEQSEPESVQAEPVPEYNNYYGSYQNIPPYGQRNGSAGAGYGGQPSAYGTQRPYGAQQQPYGNRPPYGTQAPYGTQPPYGSAYTPPQQSQPPQQPAKKSKKGLKIFFRVLIAVIIVSLVFTVVRLAMDRPTKAETAAGNNNSTTAAEEIDAPEMETKSSPASDSKFGSGQTLTPTQIAAKVRAWSVGILVYSGNASGTAGQGSGVLWKEDGGKTYTYIITCAHVVSGSGYTYSVQTEDGKTYDAELVGADAKTDLAVLRIKTTGLSLAEFGDSSALQVGDPVYAIGNPGGTEFFGSFTSGIVSAIDRSVKNTYTMLCIQHTAAINPGNSGGALVNEYGQVIGINSQKIASTDYEGMGFAIPVKSAQSIISSLASYGYVKDRPRLGITYAEALNYQQYSMIIKIRGLPSGTLVISEISSDSSLANTEAKSGDMIIKVNGKDMTTPNVLLDKIENGKVGDKLTLTLCRMDNNYQFKSFDVTVTLIEEVRQSNQKEETTTQQSYYGFDPFDFFNGNYGNFFGN